MKRDRLLGAAALLGWAIHAAGHLARGELHDLLWLCSMATLILAAGCFTRAPAVIAVSLLWLSFGTVLWSCDLLAGAPLDSALFTHVGSLAIAIVALRRRRVPAGSWAWATAGLVAFVALARVATPAERNVNLAWGVSAGWEGWFPSYPVYLLVLFALGAAVFFVVERAAVRA